MEIAKAFKQSSREFFFQQALGDEIFCVNANNVVVGGDDFSVDDLLDLSNGDLQHASLHYEHLQQQYSEEKDSSSFSSQSQEDSNSYSAGVSIFSDELAVPNDDLAELEWVSHFVDDSLPELSLLYPVRPDQPKTRPEPKPRASSVQRTPRFPSVTKVPTKARTEKNRKPNARACLFITPLLSRPSSPSSCSSSVVSSTAQQPPAKRQKKRADAQEEGGAQAQAQLQRRCSHCQVQKTPQWRTGPLGPKTLCNACGVRFKSGRLFDEYRPACSPTFSSEIHSNSHRKVLEMRKRKGMVGPDTGSVQSHLVPTC